MNRNESSTLNGSNGDIETNNRAAADPVNLDYTVNSTTGLTGAGEKGTYVAEQ